MPINSCSALPNWREKATRQSLNSIKERPNRVRPRPAIMEAEANLRDAQIRLSYTEIKTPISGRIERAAVSPGNLVGPDSGVLATIVQDNPMQVLFSVTQLEMLEAKDSEVTGKVRPGEDWPTARCTARRGASIFSTSRSTREPMDRQFGRCFPIPTTFSPAARRFA